MSSSAHFWLLALSDLIKAQSVTVSEEMHDEVQMAMYTAKTALKQDRAALFPEILNSVKQNVSGRFAIHTDSLSEKGVKEFGKSFERVRDFEQTGIY